MMTTCEREEGDGEAGQNLNEDLINLVMALGVSRNAAMRGLFFTGNYNAELAAAWIFENEDKNLDAPFNPPTDENSDSDGEDMQKYKMVFVVNASLGMGPGKIAAQVAHAALGLFRKLIDSEQEMLLLWEQYGETKIVLRGKSMEQLLELASLADQSNLHSYKVYDAGRTQVEAGSLTVVSLMGLIESVDQITRSLPLL